MLGKHLVFLDSFQFMASILVKLADDLPAHKFNYTSHAFKGEKLALMKKKGVYPYADSFQKFGDQQLPQKEEFYSIFKDEGISEQQYEHAQNVWDTSGVRTMRDYLDLYLN